MNNVLVTGANGQLGNEIRLLALENSQINFIFTDVEELDITNRSKIFDLVNDKRIDSIINCAAYTAVDKAEEQVEQAVLINAEAVANLAEAAQKFDTKLIHISTDFVFDGTNFLPYNEDDKAHPVSSYGRTKLKGEKEISERKCDAMIIRTSWLYSSFGHNFLKTMIKYGKERGELKVVFDQIGSQTYAADLAKVIIRSLNADLKGIYHYSNEGVCSWYDFAKEIIDYAKIKARVHPIRTEAYPLPARRPPYSVLDKAKIKSALGIEIPHWRDSMMKCLDKMSI